MLKRVFMIHGWGGSPENDWLPWTKTSLEQLGYQMIAPLMPDTDNPQIKPWVKRLGQLASSIQENDIFIGHSIGNQTIWRFLESLPEDKIADKVIMVAPWLTLKDLEGEESWKIANTWINSPINFDQVRSKANKFVAIFSDNDPFVSLAENKMFMEKYLNAEIIVLNKKGHFTADDGVTEFPEIIDKI